MHFQIMILSLNRILHLLIIKQINYQNLSSISIKLLLMILLEMKIMIRLISQMLKNNILIMVKILKLRDFGMEIFKISMKKMPLMK